MAMPSDAEILAKYDEIAAAHPEYSPSQIALLVTEAYPNVPIDYVTQLLARRVATEVPPAQY